MESELQATYDTLEESVMNYKHDFQIPEAFVSLRDKAEVGSLVHTKAQWEIDAFGFMNMDGSLSPKYLGTDERGQPVEYPSFALFTTEAFAYFKQRHEIVRHPILKQRYAMLLWDGPTKHADYAKSATDESIKLIDFYETLDIEKPTEHHGLDVLREAKTAFQLSRQVKYKEEEVRNIIRKLILLYPLESSSGPTLICTLIELAVENKFNKEFFQGFNSTINITALRRVEQNNLHAAIDTYGLGERVCAYLKQKSCHQWIRKQAKCYESLTHNAEREGNMAMMSFCQETVHLYKKLKDKNKIAFWEKQFDELKSKLKLQTVSTSVDTTELQKYIAGISRSVAEKPAKTILAMLILDKGFLPDIEKVKARVIKHKKEFVFMHLVSTEVLDSNLNTSDTHQTDAERDHYHLLQQYQIELEIEKIPLINSIIFESVKRNPLFFKEVIEYFNESSWYGKSLKKNTGTGEVMNYNWLSLIAPGINDYVAELRKWTLGLSYPNSVLVIDSLTLKIEGIIRDLCHLNKVSTTYFKEGRGGKQLTEEADLAFLLNKKELEKFIAKEDLFFIKFLLIEKAGYNLRHQVAHSLMLYPQYGLTYANLLLLVIFRLGKYDVVNTKKRSEKA